MRPMLFETPWGVGLIGQTGVAIVASFAFGAVPRSGAWPVAAGATLLLTVTPALSGHAVAEARPALGVTLDTLHVLAGGIWLGTLTVLVAVSLPVLGDATARKALQEILIRFSKVALTSAAVVTVTGVYAAWVHVGSWGALWSTPYGDALLLKLCTVALAVLLGAINWRVAVPRLTLGRVPRFAATGSAEVFTALLIYLLTAVLVGRPLPLE
jgi:putative copper export protein